MNRTVLRTVEILEIIARNDEISLAELVRITGYPKTSVYDILHALEDRAMIYRCKDKICYGIGFRAYAIGRTYSKNSDLLNSAEILANEVFLMGSSSPIEGDSTMGCCGSLFAI